MIIKGEERYEGVLEIPAGKVGDQEISHERYPAGHKFDLAPDRAVIVGGQKRGTVSFDHETSWHRLAGWMTDLPVEQRQCDVLVDGVKSGTVLVGGLGLGYAATVLARRPRIREVVVVEKSKGVIDLVWDATLENAGRAAARKLQIVHEDLHETLRRFKKAPALKFDWAFYDIWAQDNEGTFHDDVVPLLKASDGLIRNRPLCWNEDVMRGQLRMAIENRLMMVTTPELRQGQTEAYWLERLTAKTGSIWIEWCAPFFRWYQEAAGNGVTQEGFREAASWYARHYGEPRFLERFNVVQAGCEPTELQRGQA